VSHPQLTCMAIGSEVFIGAREANGKGIPVVITAISIRGKGHLKYECSYIHA